MTFAEIYRAVNTRMMGACWASFLAPARSRFPSWGATSPKLSTYFEACRARTTCMQWTSSTRECVRARCCLPCSSGSASWRERGFARSIIRSGRRCSRSQLPSPRLRRNLATSRWPHAVSSCDPRSLGSRTRRSNCSTSSIDFSPEEATQGRLRVPRLRPWCYPRRTWKSAPPT